MNISCNDRTMKTAIYVKMNAPEKLLLSEGVCCQLHILNYHPDVPLLYVQVHFATAISLTL